MHKTVNLIALFASVAVIAFAGYLSQHGLAGAITDGNTAISNCQTSTPDGQPADGCDQNGTTGKPGEVKGR